MIVPASIYIWFNWETQLLSTLGNSRGDGYRVRPALLSIFGSMVPLSLKVFLLALAIFDDLAAVIIIAVFYSQDHPAPRFYLPAQRCCSPWQ